MKLSDLLGGWGMLMCMQFIYRLETHYTFRKHWPKWIFHTMGPLKYHASCTQLQKPAHCGVLQWSQCWIFGANAAKSSLQSLLQETKHPETLKDISRPTKINECCAYL